MWLGHATGGWPMASCWLDGVSKKMLPLASFVVRLPLFGGRSPVIVLLLLCPARTSFLSAHGTYHMLSHGLLSHGMNGRYADERRFSACLAVGVLLLSA